MSDPKCQECGGCHGAHRQSCRASDNGASKQWLTCQCGTRVFIRPVREYHGDEWGGCELHHACDTCALLGNAALLAKVKEVFGP